MSDLDTENNVSSVSSKIVTGTESFISKDANLGRDSMNFYQLQKHYEIKL